MRHVAVGNGGAFEVDVSDAVVVASPYGAAHVPAVQRVEADVERCSAVSAPVAVDVLGPADASAGRFVIGDHVAYGVSGALETSVGVEAPVALGFGHHEPQAVLLQLVASHHLEVGVEVAGERRFQPRVTHGDVERLGVVVDVEQLGDVGLLSLSPQSHLKVGLLVEAVAQVHGWRQVGDRPHGINGLSQVLLNVVRFLRLYLHAGVDVVFLPVDAQLQVDVVVILRSLGISAEVL